MHDYGNIDRHIKIHISIFAFNIGNSVENENNGDDIPCFYLIVLEFVDACAILQRCAHLMDRIYMLFNLFYSTCLR